MRKHDGIGSDRGSHVLEKRVSQFSGHILPVPGRHEGMRHAAFPSPVIGQTLHKRLIRIRFGATEPVIHMRHHATVSRFVQQMQKDDGIESAAHRYHKGLRAVRQVGRCEHPDG